LAAQLDLTYVVLREEHLGLTPHALDLFRALRARKKCLGLIMSGNATYQLRKLSQRLTWPQETETIGTIVVNEVTFTTVDPIVPLYSFL